MHKYMHISSIHQVDRYISATNENPECPEKYKVRTPVRYRGTVKLHGVNSGVGICGDAFVPQSREAVLGEGRDEHGNKLDPFGFYRFVTAEAQARVVRKIEQLIRTAHRIAEDHELFLYGEWCGPGIMRGVAINELPDKQWVLFGARVVGPERDEHLDVVGPLGDCYAAERIYSIADGPSWELEIDYSSDGSKQRALEHAAELVSEVERRCPWAARFGVEGLGEGIVWQPVGDHWGREDLYFKVKGAKHSKVKTKRDRPEVAPEVLDGIREFVEFSTTEGRLEQGIEVLVDRSKPVEMRSIGEYLKWIAEDVQRECAPELEASGLDWKQVSKAVLAKAKDFFTEKLREK
jgi:hypothetical protein